jgi:glutamate-ammonia-ligase adenylyltransferase
VGDTEIGRWFEQARRTILQAAREPATLQQEVAAMRQKMLDGHPNPTALFDLKHDRGGMVDIEFMVQYLVLAHAHQYPALLDNVGNIALLKRAAEVGLIQVDQARTVAHAYRVYRSLQHILRLQGHDHARLPLAEVAAECQAVKSLWSALLGAVDPSPA